MEEKELEVMVENEPTPILKGSDINEFHRHLRETKNSKAKKEFIQKCRKKFKQITKD